MFGISLEPCRISWQKRSKLMNALKICLFCYCSEMTEKLAKLQSMTLRTAHTSSCRLCMEEYSAKFMTELSKQMYSTWSIHRSRVSMFLYRMKKYFTKIFAFCVVNRWSSSQSKQSSEYLLILSKIRINCMWAISKHLLSKRTFGCCFSIYVLHLYTCLFFPSLILSSHVWNSL